MKKFVRIMSVLTAACLILTALAGCGGSNGGSSAKIKIGGIGPITGGAAIYGNAVKNAAEIAVEEINAKGGDIQFEFMFEDDEHDAEKSVNAYNKLKDKGMQILMGTVTTTPCIAVSSEANADSIFELTPSASSTDVIGGQPDKDGNVTIQRKSNVFQMCFTDPNQGTASADYIKEKALGTKIAVIYNNGDAYSTGIYQKFEARAKELGLNVVSVTTFPSDDNTDFTVQLTDAKSAGADLVFLPIYYTPASLILAQAKSMGYTPGFFGCDGMDGILTLEGFDTSLAEGLMLMTPFNAADEGSKSFVDKYVAAYGEEPNQFAADGYDCIYAIRAAIEKAGLTPDMDAQTICEKMIETFTASDFSVDGLTGTGMTWSTAGEVTKQPVAVKVTDGAYVNM